MDDEIEDSKGNKAAARESKTRLLKTKSSSTSFRSKLN